MEPMATAGLADEDEGSRRKRSLRVHGRLTFIGIRERGNQTSPVDRMMMLMFVKTTF
jgi:hypothetical protein